MTYDPNYNYDEDYSCVDDSNENIDDEDETEDNDEYSDDDDMSWKVRRSAAKCLEAIISTRHELLPEFYKILSPALVARFKGKFVPVGVGSWMVALSGVRRSSLTVENEVEKVHFSDN